MQQITNETRKKIVREHIQDGRTLASLSAEYGVSKALFLYWVRAYRKNAKLMITKNYNLNLWKKSVSFDKRNQNSKRRMIS